MHPWPERGRKTRWALTVAVAAALTGCASTAIDDNLVFGQKVAAQQFGAELKWLTTDDARRQALAEVDAALSKPLGSDDAVRIALAHSPAMQAILFEAAGTSAGATQSARLPNPVFAFERLARRDAAVRELEITRTLSVSLFDLLLLPSRMRLADHQQQQIRLKLAGDVVRVATEARRAWVRAVAAQQSLQYVRQVKTAADASAELARRLQSVGNFSKLQRAREQAFSAEAVVQVARAEQEVLSSREALVRALGFSDAQARAMTLPDRLPELPSAPRDEQSVAQAALDQRLDLRVARARLEFSAREQGLTRVTSVVNGFEIAGASKSETGLATQRGYALQMPLPVFDFGDASRSRAQATYMAALQRTAQLAVEASSQTRERYAGYRSAYEVARHYRDEIVPLRKAISQENQLRYNGMLIGVFELLADAREQVASVLQALAAQRDFWLADAALQATLIGSPGPAMNGGDLANSPHEAQP